MRRSSSIAILVAACVLWPATASAANVEGFIYGPTKDAAGTVGHVDNLTVKYVCQNYTDCSVQGWLGYATLSSGSTSTCRYNAPRIWESTRQRASGTVESGARDFP